MKQKSPFLRIKKKRAFTIQTSRFTSFTTKKFFGKTLQAGLLTGGSSYWLHLPGKLSISLNRLNGLPVVLAAFVTDYSGGTVPFFLIFTIRYGIPFNSFHYKEHLYAI
jgi:hypothetical protein